MPTDAETKALREAISGVYKTPAGPPPPLEDAKGDWKAWLKALHASLWETTKRPHSRNPYERNWTQEARRLTDEEWTTVQGVLREHAPHIVCEIHNACMGFGCGLAVYEEPPRIFPGVDEKPGFLIDITKDHLPLTVCGLREPGEHGIECRDRTFFKDGWRAFSPFSHNENNARLLKEYGFEAPKSEGHYDY